MTDDLLGKVFYHLCETGPLSLRHLLFVSRRFYLAAVNDAHLWTTISLDSSFCCHFRKLREQGNGFIEQCLLRSRPLPLCLYVNDSNLRRHDITFLLRSLKTFGGPKWRGFQRCTSLIWVDGGHRATTTKKILALLPKSLPSLQHISLSFFDDAIDGSQIPNCPTLERVEMLGNQQPFPFFSGKNFLHVTTLSIGNYSHWANHNIATLSLFPGLHDLTLFTERGMGILFHYDPQPRITFNRLHILRVHGYTPPGVLTHLVAPALKELHIKANAKHLTSMYGLRHSFEPHCQHLHAVLPSAVSTAEPEWATDLLMLVQKCTKIRTLYISKWMEKKCKKFMSNHDDVVLHVQ
jgi:hypothetical protein